MLVVRCFAPVIADPPVPEAVEHLARHLTLCHPAASLELVGLGVSELLPPRRRGAHSYRCCDRDS